MQVVRVFRSFWGTLELNANRAPPRLTTAIHDTVEHYCGAGIRDL